jgi:hypothetical protein
MLIGWRKFIAYIIACVLVWFGKIPAEVWLIFGLIFIGGNVFSKWIDFKKGK